MNTLIAAFLRGLTTLLPIVLTLYLVYIVATSSEKLMGGLLRRVLPVEYYLPGLGLLAAVVGVTVLGLVIRLPLLRLALRLSNALFSRVPLVKSVYSTLSDLMGFFAEAKASGEKGKPVLVEVAPGVKVMGFVSNTSPGLGGDPDNIDPGMAATDKVLVYLPMSYQIGGYTVLVDQGALEPINMGVEEAMSFVLTAGVKRSDAH